MARLARLLLPYLYEGHDRRIFIQTPYYLRLLHPQCFRFRAQAPPPSTTGGCTLAGLLAKRCQTCEVPDVARYSFIHQARAEP